MGFEKCNESFVYLPGSDGDLIVVTSICNTGLFMQAF
jgi:hypothetical protein